MSTGNYLLDSMSTDLRDAILAASHACDFSAQTVLLDKDTDPKHLVFLTQGFASAHILNAAGLTTEVAMTGREGLVGAQTLLADVPLRVPWVMQGFGAGLAVPRTHLRMLFRESEEFREKIHQLVHNQVATAMQTIACCAHHRTPARLASWLLMACDRLGGNRLTITQAEIASRLGVQRSTVVAAAGQFMDAGLLHYRRGVVKISDRAGLEEAACECYPICSVSIRKLYKMEVRGATPRPITETPMTTPFLVNAQALPEGQLCQN